MAETRVEKYKDYRKSMLTDGNPVIKTAIETSLETTSIENNVSPSYQEAVFLKNLQNKRRFYIISFFAVITIYIALAITFGLILF